MREPGGRELEREGDAVEAVTDARDGRRSLFIKTEVRRDLACPFDKELHRRELRDLLGDDVVRGRHLERRYSEDDLPRKADRLAARRQDGDVGTLDEKLPGNVDAGIQEVLAVVEY